VRACEAWTEERGETGRDKQEGGEGSLICLKELLADKIKKN
jgi:hypothetical protein